MAAQVASKPACARVGGLARLQRSTAHRCQLPAARPRTHAERLAAPRAAVPVMVAMAEAPTSESPAELRKALTEKGWRSNWVDGIVEEAKKKKLQTTAAQACEAADALVSMGFRDMDVENICAKAPGVLGRSPSDLAAVKDYMVAQGATDAEIRSIVLKTPRVLLYSPSSDSKQQLVLGKARMELDITTRGEKRVPVLSMYREGCAFESAPVSPWKPVAEK